MEYKKFSDALCRWGPKFKRFIESEDMDKIYHKLKSDSKVGKKLTPDSKDTFRVFCEVPPEKLRVVWFLQDPYPSIKNGELVATGVALDCSRTKVLQASLEIFYDSMERELANGMDLGMIKDPSLDHLLKQGIMLINSDLTCEVGKSGSHEGLWKPFMRYFIEEILNKEERGLIFVLSGKSSQRLEKYINPLQHYIFKTSHPASAAYLGKNWDSEGIFGKINNILKQNNGEEYQIDWIDSVPF